MFGLVKESKYKELVATFENLNKCHTELIKEKSKMETTISTLKNSLKIQEESKKELESNYAKLEEKAAKDSARAIDCFSTIKHLEDELKSMAESFDESLGDNEKMFDVLSSCYEILSVVKEKNNSAFKYKAVKNVYRLLSYYMDNTDPTVDLEPVDEESQNINTKENE